MRPSTLLKAASVATGLLFAGHTLGRPWTPAASAPAAAVVAGMKSTRFPVMGVERGYWDFYQGFGLTVSLFLLAFAVLLWQAARMSAQSPACAQAVARTSLAAFLGMAALEGAYFFAAPVILTLPILALLALASRKLGHTASG